MRLEEEEHVSLTEILAFVVLVSLCRLLIAGTRDLCTGVCIRDHNLPPLLFSPRNTLSVFPFYERFLSSCSLSALEQITPENGREGPADQQMKERSAGEGDLRIPCLLLIQPLLRGNSRHRMKAKNQ